jgi:RND superfamily putative drug exporter
MLDRLARLVTRSYKAILVCTFLFVGVAAFYGHDVADHLLAGGFSDQSAESAQAARLLDEKFSVGRPDVVLLVRAPDGVDSPAAAAAARRLTAQFAAEPSVGAVGSYWRDRTPSLRSTDGRIGLVVGRIKATEDGAERLVEGLAARYRGPHGPVTVQVGGKAAVRQQLDSGARADIARAEAIGIPLVALALIVVFRSFVAAFLPLVVGGVAMVGTVAALKLISQGTDVSIFSLNLATGLSLGLAADYGLFIVRRYREELRRSGDVETALRATLNTAGRTILFSSLTVAVAVATMVLFPVYFLRSFAYAGVSVVALAALAALVALPAGLVALGPKVNALDPSGLLRRGRARRARELSGAHPAPEAGGSWRRLAERVMRRPVLAAVVPTALLLLLGAPFLRVDLGIADDRSLPPGAESHTVQE